MFIVNIHSEVVTTRIRGRWCRAQAFYADRAFVGYSVTELMSYFKGFGASEERVRAICADAIARKGKPVPVLLVDAGLTHVIVSRPRR